MDTQPLHERRIPDPDALLRIIEDADTEAILLEENMDSFNELMKYELISILDGQVHLTERGKQAKHEGVQMVIGRLRSEPQPHTAPPAFIDRKLYYVLFLLLLLIIVAVTISLKAG